MNDDPDVGPADAGVVLVTGCSTGLGLATAVALGVLVNDAGAGFARSTEQASEADEPPIRVRTSEWAEKLCRLKTHADPDGKRLQDEVIERFL